MATIVNAHQSEAWNGYEGEHWARNQARYDAVNSGFNDALLDAAGVGPGARVLDVGCGNGQVTRLAARRSGDGEALGVDLSAPMLARAAASAAAEGVRNVRFERGDAQVHGFTPGAFDAAVSRFGIMFFADPVAAFANIGTALRPGGRLAFLSMTGMAGTDLGVIFGALAPYLPEDVGGGHGTGPTSLSDPEHAKNVLTRAGYRDATAGQVEAPSVWGTDADDAADFLIGWGPVRFLARDLDAAARARMRSALVAALRPYERDGGVRTRGTALLVRAVWPGVR